MEQTAHGRFDVQLTPVPDTAIPQMTIVKTFHGDLEGTSSGTMLAIRTATEGSAGYVAMETVTGTLGGRRGSFALQHSGTMTRGQPTLSVTVVPDSGTGALKGLEGAMDIDLSGGDHRYTVQYSLPEQEAVHP